MFLVKSSGRVCGSVQAQWDFAHLDLITSKFYLDFLFTIYKKILLCFDCFRHLSPTDKYSYYGFNLRIHIQF